MNARIVALVALAFIFVVSVGKAWPFDQVGPVQAGTNRNQTATATGANAITIAAVANQKVRIYSISGACASGSASITITNAGNAVWAGVAALTTAFANLTFPTPLTGGLGSAVVVTASNCFNGGGASTLNVQADQY